MAMSDGFGAGVKSGFPVMVSATPFAALFGAVAVDNGQTVLEAGLMSATVYAGASQLVGIELFGHHVAPWLIVLSIFAVNFRHILYSAALAPHVAHWSFLQKALGLFMLTDPQFAETVKRGERTGPVGFAWYMGFALVIYVPWLIVTLTGALAGKMIGDPKVIGIDVLLPIYFLGLVLGFRKRENFLPVALAAGLGSILAWHFIGSPWHVSVGALAGILVAVALPLKPAMEG